MKKLLCLLIAGTIFIASCENPKKTTTSTQENTPTNSDSLKRDTSNHR